MLSDFIFFNDIDQLFDSMKMDKRLLYVFI
jgi:hypothetical protein